jgi:UMP-CMP kinase
VPTAGEGEVGRDQALEEPIEPQPTGVIVQIECNVLGTATIATMAATACGRQAWRQLMRNTSRGPAANPSNVLRQQRQLHSRFPLSRQISSTARSSPRRAVPQSPSSFLRQQPLAQRSYSSGQAHPPPRGSNNQVKFWPFLIVIALGSGGYILLVNRRKGELA